MSAKSVDVQMAENVRLRRWIRFILAIVPVQIIKV